MNILWNCGAQVIALVCLTFVPHLSLLSLLSVPPLSLVCLSSVSCLCFVCLSSVPCLSLSCLSLVSVSYHSCLSLVCPSSLSRITLACPLSPYLSLVCPSSFSCHSRLSLVSLSYHSRLSPFCPSYVPCPPLTRWSWLSDRDKPLIDLCLSEPLTLAGSELGRTLCCVLACLSHSTVKAPGLSSWLQIRALSWDSDSNETLAPQGPEATLQFPSTWRWCWSDIYLLDAGSWWSVSATRGTFFRLKPSQCLCRKLVWGQRCWMKESGKRFQSKVLRFLKRKFPAATVIQESWKWQKREMLCSIIYLFIFNQEYKHLFL